MTEKKTLIIDLSHKENDKIPVNIGDELDVIHDYLMDGSVSLSNRSSLLNNYYIKYGEDQTIEIISRIATMYQFSGTKILEKYLYEICIECKLSAFLKIIAAKSLCYFDPDKELGYKALNAICQDMKDVATPCKIEAICLLMLHKTYKKQSLMYFCHIINNLDLECDYRYKTILSLENKDIPNLLFFIKESTIEFFNNQNNRTLYRILSGQYLIQKCKLKKDIQDKIEITLISFAQDPDLDYNLRADSADVILRLGSSGNKIIAREIIMILGRQDGTVKTIFDNAQNVHIDEIEQSVLEALEFLSSIEIKTLSDVPGTTKITFEYVKKQVENELETSKPNEPKDYEKFVKLSDKSKKLKKNKYMIQYEKEKKIYDEKEDKINISLNRIYLDRALYSNYNCSLLHILLKIWTYITTHKSEKDMKNRLLEELIDMSGTCSSGFASRLVNVISGYGDFNLSISWRDQIVANFNGRLNARARDITNESKIQQNNKLYRVYTHDCNWNDEKQRNVIALLEKFQEDVLSEMTVNSNDFKSRRNFLKFFRKNMLGIREELYEEFKEHIPDTDFDLYFRAAISTYETGGYV
jgi:hypothetical protein